MAAVVNLGLLQKSNLVLRNVFAFHTSVISRVDEKWKETNNQHLNPQHNHQFKEWPDYSFVDGRPTPLSSNQYERWKNQRQLSATAVQLLKEINYVVSKEQKLQEEAELGKQRRLANKLKPKGANLIKLKSTSES